ncbi:MAG: hypothetical protein U9N86_17430 [Bacteroidota bacterium]|nr:hypothetical protein [Bacteroidota bacterium]
MGDITIGLSPGTNTIFAGRLNKEGTMWQGEKYDVTDQCVMTVVNYIKKDRVIYERDGKRYEMKEVEINT